MHEMIKFLLISHVLAAFPPPPGHIKLYAQNTSAEMLVSGPNINSLYDALVRMRREVIYYIKHVLMNPFHMLAVFPVGEMENTLK